MFLSRLNKNRIIYFNTGTQLGRDNIEKTERRRVVSPSVVTAAQHSVKVYI